VENVRRDGEDHVVMVYSVMAKRPATRQLIVATPQHLQHVMMAYSVMAKRPVMKTPGLARLLQHLLHAHGSAMKIIIDVEYIMKHVSMNTFMITILCHTNCILKQLVQKKQRLATSIITTYHLVKFYV
jgi:hypothetical protein